MLAQKISAVRGFFVLIACAWAVNASANSLPEIRGAQAEAIFRLLESWNGGAGVFPAYPGSERLRNTGLLPGDRFAQLMGMYCTEYPIGTNQLRYLCDTTLMDQQDLPRLKRVLAAAGVYQERTLDRLFAQPQFIGAPAEKIYRLLASELNVGPRPGLHIREEVQVRGILILGMRCLRDWNPLGGEAGKQITYTCRWNQAGDLSELPKLQAVLRAGGLDEQSEIFRLRESCEERLAKSEHPPEA